MQTMKALKALGIGIAIDEFGAGNSGLAHLSQYPVDRLKIDKTFVSGIGSDPDDEAICRTIILLARDLKLQVIAEGVATEQQLDFLRVNGCDAAQGYLFSGNPIAREESPVPS